MKNKWFAFLTIMVFALAGCDTGTNGNYEKNQNIWNDAYFADYCAGLSKEATNRLNSDEQYQYFIFLQTRILGTTYNLSNDIVGSISAQAIDVNQQDIASYAAGINYKAAYERYEAAIAAGKGSLPVNWGEINGIDNEVWTQFYFDPGFSHRPPA